MSELSRLLQEWEGEWTRLGLPVEEALSPGLELEHVVDTLTSTFGTVNEELPQWFVWHDGSPPGLNVDAAPIGAPILPLALCLRERETQMAVSRNEVPDHYPDIYRWDAHWLPLTPDSGGGSYVVDTATGQVLDVSWWSGEDLGRVVAEDMASAVQVWLEVLRGGYYQWADGRWQYDYTAVPQHLRATGLVG
jgi:cell wall assembly regulator SMI1